MNNAIFVGIAYVVLGPVLGCLLAGLDRILSARLQGRVGPPLLQPLYDIQKLWDKQFTQVTPMQEVYVVMHLLFAVVAGALFFIGGDFLLVVFALTIAAVFLVLAAYAPSSPFSKVGADRELIQMMAYEPFLILLALGFYEVTGSFRVDKVLEYQVPLAYLLPGMALAMVPLLVIKMRKSPFDLSYSHHAHQEIVRGIATDLSGRTLAMMEVAHWYETVLLLGVAYVLFAGWGVAIAILAETVYYLLVIWIDNSNARLTWRYTLTYAWVGTLIFGAGNLLILHYLVRHS
jgi:formate hydrogenlyase subunit 4